MAVMLFSLASIGQKCIRLRITLSQKGRQRFHIAFARCSIPIIHRCKYTHCINRGSWDNLLLWIKHRVSRERAGFLPGTSSSTVPLALRSRQHSCDTFPLSPPFLPITHHVKWMNGLCPSADRKNCTMIYRCAVQLWLLCWVFSLYVFFLHFGIYNIIL